MLGVFMSGLPYVPRQSAELVHVDDQNVRPARLLRPGPELFGDSRPAYDEQQAIQQGVSHRGNLRP